MSADPAPGPTGANQEDQAQPGHPPGLGGQLQEIIERLVAQRARRRHVRAAGALVLLGTALAAAGILCLALNVGATDSREAPSGDFETAVVLSTVVTAAAALSLLPGWPTADKHKRLSRGPMWLLWAGAVVLLIAIAFGLCATFDVT